MAALVWLGILLIGLGMGWLLVGSAGRARWRHRLRRQSFWTLLIRSLVGAAALLIGASLTESKATFELYFLKDGLGVAAAILAVAWCIAWVRRAFPGEWEQLIQGKARNPLTREQLVWGAALRIGAVLFSAYFLFYLIPHVPR